MPPLRERKEDIPLLFDYFAASAAEAHRPRVAPGVRRDGDMLMAHDWPGNVRELRNAAERHALGLGGFAAQPAEETKLSLAEQVDAFERAMIERSLAESRRQDQRA